MSNEGASPSFVDTEGRFVEVDPLSLHFVGHLGRGTYGNVQKAEWRGVAVAVKVIENDSDSDRKVCINEINLLRKLVHRNIIRVYGACSRPKIALVMELMENGSMHDLLHVRMNLQYKADHALSWSRQCADAVSFMHEQGFVHRDLKPPNLLLRNGYRLLKVCDFGTVARLKATMTNNRGSASWMAPEVFSGSKYNEKCDVYSFGIILWEMITRRKPFEDVQGSALAIMWKAYQDARPPPIANCPDKLMSLIERCWHKSADTRPSMLEVLHILTAFAKVFPEGDTELLDASTSEAFSTQHTDPNTISYLDAPPSTTLRAVECSSSASLHNESSLSVDSGSHSAIDQHSLYARLTNEENIGEEQPLWFLNCIDRNLMPIQSTCNSQQSDEMYLAQLTGCKDVYELNNQLSQALTVKHALLWRLRQHDEMVKLKRTKEQLCSMLEKSGDADKQCAEQS